jgi:hypothetical protein
VQVDLPPATADRAGAYAVGQVLLNGKDVGTGFLSPSQLQPTNLLEIALVDTPEAADTLTLVTDPAEYKNLFGPLTPAVTGISPVGGKLQVSFHGGGESASGITFNIYRDGVRVASNVPGNLTSWTDPNATTASPSYCYTVETAFVLSGTVSQHSKPYCWWGTGDVCIQSFTAGTFDTVGGDLATTHGRVHFENWGQPGDTVTIHNVTPAFTGPYLVQAVYANGSGSIDAGITCGAKRVVVQDEANDAVVGDGVLVMPQAGMWDQWRDSTFVRAALATGHTYRISLSHDTTTQNMSDFQFNTQYSGIGGTGGAYHNVDIAEIKLLSLTGNP